MMCGMCVQNIPLAPGVLVKVIRLSIFYSMYYISGRNFYIWPSLISGGLRYTCGILKKLKEME